MCSCEYAHICIRIRACESHRWTWHQVSSSISCLSYFLRQGVSVTLSAAIGLDWEAKSPREPPVFTSPAVRWVAELLHTDEGDSNSERYVYIAITCLLCHPTTPASPHQPVNVKQHSWEIKRISVKGSSLCLLCSAYSRVQTILYNSARITHLAIISKAMKVIIFTWAPFGGKKWKWQESGSIGICICWIISKCLLSWLNVANFLLSSKKKRGQYFFMIIL